MKHSFRALRYFRADAPLAGVVAALVLAGAALGAVKPWPLSILVDCVFSGRPAPPWLQDLVHSSQPSELVPWLVALVFLFHLGQGAVSGLYTYLSIDIGLRGLRRVRQELFEKLMRLSLRFYQSSQTGDVIYRATWDTYAFQTYFQQGWITFLTATASLVIMVVVMARIDLRLTLTALATVPFLLLAIRQLSSAMKTRSRVAQQSDSQVSSTVQQDLTAMAVIQSYVQEKREISKYHGQLSAAHQSRLAQHAYEVIYGVAVTSIFAGGAAAISWVGAREVLAGKLTIGQLLVFLAYLAQFYEPLNQLSHVGATLSGAGASMARVFEILDAHEDIQSTTASPTTGSSAIRPDGNAIRFENVSFNYSPSRNVLDGINLVIPDRSSVALIGPSGAGKSTLLSLLPRFFDPAAGRITLGGIDLKDWPLESLRQQIALVFQEPILLPSSIADNIAFGRPDATVEEIKAAAIAAHAHEFIEKLPSGYDTLVGDGAARLSVGEKQRLSLARAFLKNAPILLLDEPTSSLDRENEALVTQSLQRLMSGRTTLMVAHRLATVQSADQIVVLRDGKITEAGSATDLLAREGYFRRVQEPEKR